MTAETLAVAIGQVVALAGFLFWLAKKNTEKIERLVVDVAIVKETILFVREDHDGLIVIDTRLKKLERDMDAAHDKIRVFKEEHFNGKPRD